MPRVLTASAASATSRNDIFSLFFLIHELLRSRVETIRVIVPGPGHALTRAVVPRPDRVAAVQHVERKMAIHDKIDHAPGEGQFDFNFGFLGFDIDFCFSLNLLNGFIAVDETVTKIFTFTNNEVSNFHLFLRDMIVAFVNEDFSTSWKREKGWIFPASNSTPGMACCSSSHRQGWHLDLARCSPPCSHASSRRRYRDSRKSVE